MVALKAGIREKWRKDEVALVASLLRVVFQIAGVVVMIYYWAL